MYVNPTVQDAFIGLVGLRQTDHPDFPQIDTSLTYTGTNILVHHALLNIENIDMSARNYSKFIFPAYAAGTDYFIGDRVDFSGTIYESLTGVIGTPNVGNQPDTNPADWKEVNLLSLYIEDVLRASIDDTVNGVFRKKKLNRQTKMLLQNQRMTDGVGSIGDSIINEGALVGVEIKLKHRNNIQAVINKIGFQVTLANPTLKFLLYHSSQEKVIATIQVNHTKLNSFQWHQTETKLNYNSDDHEAGGVFYLMYDQNDLVGQAIKKKHNFNLPPCHYCNRSEVNYFNAYTKYLIMRTVKVQVADRNGIDLWDISKTKYVSDNNFGLNFEWTMKCDITNFIVQQKDVFAFALRDMFIKKLLEELMHSTRQNSNQEKLELKARAELQNQSVGGLGLINQVENGLKEVDFEISALDETCMPCNTKGGMRIHASGLSYGR